MARRIFRGKRVLPNSLGSLILEYRQTPEWDALAPASKKSYETAFHYMQPLHRVAIKSIKRRHVKILRDRHRHTWGIANLVVGVFSRLMNYAVDMEYRESNPASNIPKMKGGHYNRWSDEAVDYAVANMPERFARAVLLALYTAQRQGDVLAMTWADYDGEAISVTQQKTGAKLWIPCHAALKAHLDRWKEDRTSTHICTSSTGGPWRKGNFNVAFSRERNKHVELSGLQFHGLRKTAAAKLAEAGCSLHEIAAITGHQTLAMLTLYTAEAEQRTRARAAIVKLEARK